MTKNSDNTSEKDKTEPIDKVNSHSKKLRIINNIIILIIIFGLGAFIYFINFEDQKVSEVEKIVHETTEANIDMAENNIEIKNSIISGIDGRDQYYEISSEKIWNTKNNQDVVEMSGIRTKLMLKNNFEVTIVGKSAIFNNKTKSLKLDSDIKMSSNREFEVFLKNIDIDLRNKIIHGTSPVVIKYEDICIKGNDFEINNNGDKITFTNGVNFTVGANTQCLIS